MEEVVVAELGPLSTDSGTSGPQTASRPRPHRLRSYQDAYHLDPYQVAGNYHPLHVDGGQASAEDIYQGSLSQARPGDRLGYVYRADLANDELQQEVGELRKAVALQ